MRQGPLRACLPSCKGDIANFDQQPLAGCGVAAQVVRRLLSQERKLSKWLNCMHQSTGEAGGGFGLEGESVGQSTAAKPKASRGVAGLLDQSDAGHWYPRGRRSISKWL